MQQCSKLHRSHIFNMRNFVFQIVPKLSYETSKEMRREIKSKKLNQLENQVNIDTNDLKQTETQKFLMLEKRIAQQNENNEAWIQRNIGKKVHYGSQIQLRHVDSKMFIQHAKKASNSDRRCQQLELSYDPSSQRVTFIIQQRYKYRQDGEPVVYMDHILLYNQKYNCYIHVSEDFVKQQEKLRCPQSIYRPLSPRRRDAPEEIYRKMEANCSRNFFKWQIIPFRQAKQGDSQKFIFSQDVIRLKHAETQGYLCYDISSQSKPGEPCYVRMYKGKDIDGVKTTHDLFEIEFHADFKRETIINAGNVLEWQVNSNNGYCRVRFRHLNTGKLLTLSIVDLPKDQNDPQNPQAKQQLILTVGNNLTSEQVNAKLDQTVKLEQLNKHNLQFNSLTDPQTVKFTRGVHSNRIFEIENTIIDPVTQVRAGSVVKIMNRFFNPVTKVYDNITISTEQKKIDSDERNTVDEEIDLQKFTPPIKIKQKYQNNNRKDKTQSELLDDMMEIRSFDGSIFCVPHLDKIDKNHRPDESVFTPTTYDEAEYVQQNFTKLIKDGTMEDVFILEKVDQEELNSVLFIHSCIPKIQEFLYNLRCKSQLMTSPYLKEFEELISGLIFFVCQTQTKNPFTCEGVPNLRSQNFLRELKLIDLLIDVLIYPFEGDPPLYNISELTQRSPFTKICQLIYRLLKFCVQDNEFNKFYVAQWISHFFNQSMITTEYNNLLVSDTIQEIVKNNRQLLDKQINATVIRNIVENCAMVKKNSRFLNLIAALCICNDEAIGSNQDDTCDLFLQDDDFKQLLIKVEKGFDQNKNRVYYAIIEEPEYLEQNNGEPLFIEIDKLQEYFKENQDIRLYDYFESMINLVSLMCYQRNYRGIEPCKDLYPLDFSIDSFFNPRVPLILRANLAKIILTVHLDKDPLERLNLPVLTRVWQELTTSKISIPSAKKIVPTLLKLKDFILEYFNNMNGVLRKFENSKNTLTLEILNILEKMIILGFYQNDEELIKILNPIVFVLDGSRDYVSKEDEDMSIAHQKGQVPGQVVHSLIRDKKQRYQIDENNQVIFCIKKKIIHILSIIIDFQNDLRLTQFLAEFQNHDIQLGNQPAQCAQEMFFLQNAQEGKFEDVDSEFKSKIDQKTFNWMRKAYLCKNLDMQRKSKQDITCILLDLILYQDKDVVNQAFTLLAKYFQQKKAIIKYAQDCQLLSDDQEVAILKKVTFMLNEMKRCADSSESWLGLSDQASLVKANNFMNQLGFMTDLCIFNPNRIIHFDDKKKKNDEEMKDEFEEAFINESELLAEWDNEDPKICDDDMVSDIKNQTILRNLRVHEVAITLIRQQSSDSAENINIYYRVLEKAYIFLIKFVRNNKENQTEVAKQLNLYIEDIDLGVHAWELIAETFKCADHLQNYKVTQIMKKGIKLIDILPKETLKKTILLSFLSYFIKTSGNSTYFNKEYQNLIASELTSSLRSNSDHLFVGEKGLKELRLYMLEMKNNYFEFMGDERLLQEMVIPPELCYTIEYIKILGICGQGKNSKTEQIASEKFNMDYVITNLRIADFCYPLKNALVYFMDSIYFDAEKEVSEENVEKMKEFLNIILVDLEKFVEIQLRQKSKSSQSQVFAAKRSLIEVQEVIEDLEQIVVDINKNFTMLTAFGSLEVVVIMEDYIFNTVYKALESFLNLRLPIKLTEKDFYKRLFLVIQKAVCFAKKDQHWENAKQLFNSIKEIPQLKEFGGENLSNKQLTQYMIMKDQRKNVRKPDDDEDDTNLLVGIPILTQTQKLKAYILSLSMSDRLLDDFESEFSEIVNYIINIKNRTKSTFNGTNTLEVKELISALIQVSDIRSNIDPNLRILCLKVIRKVIEIENKNSYQPAMFWEDEWTIYQEQIEKKQKMLIDLEVVNLICNLISFENKRTIKEEGLLGSAALLIGGNNESQMKFYEFILKDQQNNFILSLKEMLVESLQFIQVSQIRRNDLKMKHIQFIKQVQEYEQLQFPNRQQRVELQKLREQLRLIEEQIKETDIDESENAASYTTNDLTLKRALNNAVHILRFMQLLCENHNAFLQNILRQQSNEDGSYKPQSFDICTFFSKILEQFLMVLNNQTFDVCNQLVDTLVEMIQGPCKLNQENLVKAKIIDSCREYISGFELESDLIPLGFITEEDIDSIGEFKGSIIQMLTSLLEGEVVTEIIDRMSGSLDFYIMKQRLVKIFKRFAEKVLDQEDIVVKDLPLVKIDNRIEKDSFEDHISEAFQIYILMHQLADNNDLAAQALERSAFTPDQWKAFEFIRSHIGRIEVFIDNGLQRIYFPIKPVCHFISIEKRRQLMNDVNRESQQTKVKELIDEVPALIDEMNHNEELSRASLQITPARLMMLKDFSTFIGVIINLLYLFFAKKKYHYRQFDISQILSDVIMYLGLLQGSSSLMLIFFFSINKKNLITKQKWRTFNEKNKKLGLKVMENEDRLKVEEMSIEMTHMILMVEGPEANQFIIDQERNFGNWFTYLEFQILNIYFFIQDATFQYQVLYFGISLVGILSSTIFYSLHLLDVIQRSPVLQNVMKALIMSSEAVAMTGLLMIVFLYIFLSIYFFYLQKTVYDFTTQANDHEYLGEQRCTSFSLCLVWFLDEGIRRGGGIGEVSFEINWDQIVYFIIKLIMDMSFQIIINLIALKIIFGIIVNNFAELRDLKAKNDNDMHNVCYICNYPRMIFDKNAEGGFIRHIEKDHNLWQYVYFIVHLKSLNSSDYNGIETIVSQKLEEGDISWVPRQKAICLSKSLEDEDDNPDDEHRKTELKRVQFRVKKCLNQFEDIENKILKLMMIKEEERKQQEAKKKREEQRN